MSRMTITVLMAMVAYPQAGTSLSMSPGLIVGSLTPGSSGVVSTKSGSIESSWKNRLSQVKFLPITFSKLNLA